MSAKHTPGPWCTDLNMYIVGYPHLIVADRVVARVAHEEDARLIAAAPELLQALKDLKAAVMKYTSAPEDWPELAKALVAIEKAEGLA